MIRLSYRDVDKDFNLNPKEAELKSKLLDEIRMTSIDENWNEFMSSLYSEVDSAIDSYLKPIIAASPENQRKVELDKRWESLSPEQQNGEEGTRISDEGWEADKAVDELTQETKRGLEKVRSAMIAQVIDWKV